jgi:hypothetical protein
LLFLDVDGPLIPFAGPTLSYPGAPEPEIAGTNPLLSRIDSGVGRRLAALDCELVWATTWGEDANECVARRLGLPALAVVPWPEPSDTDELDARAGRHWKTRPIVAMAAGRAFAWVDDEIARADRDWVAAHHDGPALLLRVDPRTGLTEADFDALGDWVTTTGGPGISA